MPIGGKLMLKGGVPLKGSVKKSKHKKSKAIAAAAADSDDEEQHRQQQEEQGPEGAQSDAQPDAQPGAPSLTIVASLETTGNQLPAAGHWLQHA